VLPFWNCIFAVSFAQSHTVVFNALSVHNFTIAMPINTTLLDEFVDLMPQETVQHQLHALLDKQHSEVHAMTALLPQQREQAGSAAHRLKGACLLYGHGRCRVPH
jgi:hypothetical protein